MRYADEGLIRTSHVKRPGQTRGIRFFHLGDLHQLISAGIQTPATIQTKKSSHHH